MSFTIYVQMKKLGKQRAANLQPVPYTLAQKPDSVRELLTALTQLGVKQYNERKEEGKILSWLTKEEITEQASRGKITSGLHRKVRPLKIRFSALRTASIVYLPAKQS